MLTRPKILHAGASVWAHYTTPRPPIDALPASIKTDVLVIGAGISGAFIAQALAREGLDVVIVDRRAPLSGSTAASTALVQYEIDTPLIHLVDKIGRDKAIAAWRRSKLAVESIACKIRELDIACAYERRDTLYLSGNTLNPTALAAEQAARNQIGLRNEWLGQTALRDRFGVSAKAGLLSRDNVAINPVQLAGGLLKDACQNAARLYSGVTIDDLHHHKHHIQVVTTDGQIIKAQSVVCATGYEIPNFIRTRKHKIISTWAIATKPLKQKALQALPFIWQAADPYLYLRMTADNRLICGGEDAEFSDEHKRDALLDRKAATIERKLRKLLPDVDFTVEDKWTGAFGDSTTGLPSIGCVPYRPNVYCAMAYGGNGITFSAIAADLISAQIMKRVDPDADLFAFHKS
jgi:glycine/D-amino acid oxidase-like deaminating enzyme